MRLLGTQHPNLPLRGNNMNNITVGG